MVLFLKRPAGLNLLRPTGSLKFAVFCLLFDFFSIGVWGGRLRGGFCVLSLSFLYVWTGQSQLSWAADFMVLVG